MNYDTYYSTLDLQERMQDTLRRAYSEYLEAQAIYTALNTLALEIDALTAVSGGLWHMSTSLPNYLYALARLRADERFESIRLTGYQKGALSLVFRWRVPESEPVYSDYELPI